MGTTINTRYVDVDAEVGGDGTTNGLTGGTCAYKSLSIWEAARDADLTTGDGASNYVVERAICGSAHANHTADTTAVSIKGWTTSANSYIDILTDASNRAGTSWNTSKYRLEVTDAIALQLIEDYVRVDGLQIATVSPTASTRYGVDLGGASAANEIRLSNLLVKGHGHATYTQSGIHAGDVDYIVKAWNCIVYNIAAITSNYAVYTSSSAAFSLYSSTLIGGNFGIRAGGATVCKNVYAGGSRTEDFYRVAGALAKVNCASEDQSADDTSGADETATNCVAAAVPVNTDTFVNVTAGSQDFALAADGLSPLKGAGVDTSGDSAPLNFTTDIEGDTRDATWDIGADAWVEAAAALNVAPMAWAYYQMLRG